VTSDPGQGPGVEPGGSMLGSWLLLIIMALVVVVGLLMLAMASAG
jgi:hypothetical protein